MPCVNSSWSLSAIYNGESVTFSHQFSFCFEGHCVVDQTEKGWFVQYIDRDPETIRRQQEMARKKKMELDDEERTAQFIQVH